MQRLDKMVQEYLKKVKNDEFFFINDYFFIRLSFSKEKKFSSSSD